MSATSSPFALIASPRRRRSLLTVVVAVALVLGAAACGGDDSEGDEADRSTTSTTAVTDPDEGGGSDLPEGSTTTVDNSQGRPLNETEALIEALVAPEDVAEGLAAASGQVGDGTFQLVVCPDNEVEATWDDQASQGLLRTGGAGTLIVNQSVLAFADAETADAFVDAYVDAAKACNPSIEAAEPSGIGERAVRIMTSEDGPTGAFVRRGAHLTYVLATGDPASDLPGVVSEELMGKLADLLPA